MALEEYLGQSGLGLIQFPHGGLRSVLTEYDVEDTRVWELLVANTAEYAISVHAGPGKEPPYPVDDIMAKYVTHKSNTVTYTCPPHHGSPEAKSEYIFLFVSDCWKLREILKEEPMRLLRDQPQEVANKVLQSGWKFLPDTTSTHAAVKETILLWSAKALLLSSPEIDENTLSGAVKNAASRLGVSSRASSKSMLAV